MDNAPSSAPKRVTIQSRETYVPPPNPYLDNELANGAEEEPPPPSPVAAWLGDAQLVDCLGELVGREKLDRAEIIGVRLWVLMSCNQVFVLGAYTCIR